MTQLHELAKRFPPHLVKAAPQGKYGEYVAHSTITERLLSIVGPFDYEVVEAIREPDGQVHRDPQDRHTDGSALKNAASDALKRCAMRLGLGLHLWSQGDYFLDKQMAKLEGGVDES